MDNRVIVIAGPTASGKTALSLELAEHFGGEIVSADSMQIYRRMDIGTAKATVQERARVPHHMIDVAEPGEEYSVARYVEEASDCCDGILSRGRIPVITGGTGLYIDSLVSGRTFSERQDDMELRCRLDEEYDRTGGEAMLQRLRAFDPERAGKLHPADKRRIVRAIEVYELTGKTITEHDAETRLLPPRYQASVILLNYRNREALYRRINARVDEMVSAGLFDEVASLLWEGLASDSTAMQAIGYKEPTMALSGAITREEAVELIKLGSRRYAKRQLTWFGRTENALRILWDDEPDLSAGLMQAETFLNAEGFYAAI